MRLRLIRRIAVLLPKYGKLMYCLYRDPRLPQTNKLAFLAALALIYGPWDLPLFIPLVGEMDAIALTALAVKVFVDRAPEELVREHEALIRGGESVFDRDFRNFRGLARERVDAWMRYGYRQLDSSLREAGRTARDRLGKAAQRWRDRQSSEGREAR